MKIKLSFEDIKEMIRVEHCAGEITKEKLVAFLCNFNKNTSILKGRVVLEFGVAYIQSRVGLLDTIFEQDYDNEINYLVNVLISIMSNFPNPIWGA